MSPALGRVDDVLRGMGFRLTVVVTHPEDWVDVERPPEHIADRAFRHLPAHLDQEVLEHPPLHWRLRYRDKPNPMAPNWSCTRSAGGGFRTGGRYLARERSAAAAAAATPRTPVRTSPPTRRGATWPSEDCLPGQRRGAACAPAEQRCSTEC